MTTFVQANRQWTVEAVGTENGKSVIWLREADGKLLIAPTSALVMSNLAAEGVPVKHLHRT